MNSFNVISTLAPATVQWALFGVAMCALWVPRLSRLPAMLHQRACHPHPRRSVRGLFLALALIVSSGCSSRYSDIPAFWPFPTGDYDNYGPGRFKTAYLAEQIDRYYRGNVPGPIGVTTFVNIDDLYASSTFGRMVGEQLMSELAMRGFDVVELRHSDALQFLDSSGEFALSRDVRTVRPIRNLSAIVVGTYTTSPDRVYVNARLVDPSTSLIVSAASAEMSKTGELTKLLRGGSIPGSLERIPVKHVGYADVAAQAFENRRRQWISEESETTFAPPRRHGMVPEITEPVLPAEPPPAALKPARPALEPAGKEKVSGAPLGDAPIVSGAPAQ